MDSDDSPDPLADPRTVLVILDVIHRHLGLQELTEELVITPDFLFAICEILTSSCNRDPAPVFLAVLRCLRQNWRAQPSDTRSFSALARELAAISSSRRTTNTLSSHSRFLDRPAQIFHGPDKGKDIELVKTTPETIQACKNSQEASRRSVFEPLKAGTPLRDLRTQTPRPVAPHRARHAMREHRFPSADENEAPATSIPSKLRHAINGASTTLVQEPYNSPLRSHCDPDTNTPTRRILQFKNS